MKPSIEVFLSDADKPVVFKPFIDMPPGTMTSVDFEVSPCGALIIYRQSETQYSKIRYPTAAYAPGAWKRVE